MQSNRFGIGHMLFFVREMNETIINHSNVGEYFEDHPIAMYTCAKRLGPHFPAQLVHTSVPDAQFLSLLRMLNQKPLIYVLPSHSTKRLRVQM